MMIMIMIVPLRTEPSGLYRHRRGLGFTWSPVLILKVVKMGVDIPDTDFTSIDILRELEFF